jgi:alpha-1,2-mannosyltransferase
MTPVVTSHWSPARRFVLAIAAVLAAMVWVQGLAALLRTLAAADAPAAAVPLTFAAALLAAAGAMLLPRPYAAAYAGAAGLAVTVLLEALVPGAIAGALALPVVAGATTAGAGWLGRRLPVAIDSLWSRRRGVAVVWALVAVASVAQVGRLAAFMSDRDLDLVIATRHPFWFKHECLPAYLHGAELAQRGVDDVYHPRHYPALTPEATPQSGLSGMAVEDPYQYPPQFLLLPALAIGLTDDANVVRAVWFSLQVSLFAFAFAALAVWVGGRAGRLALWLLPAVLAAFPMLYNFQFGQFHLASVALAVLAMVAFARRWDAGGGLLLAAAILAKVFPGVLLVWLLARQRFRALGWTLGWGLASTAVTLALLGPAPFVDFLGYHVPRLASGAAFAFDEAWPELAGLVTADNQGVFGLARKLGADKPLAAQVGRFYALAVLAAAAWTGLRLRGASRWARAASWVALLGLGSLASAGAWGDYVPSVAIWLLALVAARAVEDRRWRVPLAVVASLQYFLLGTFPVGEWSPPAVMIPLSAAGVLAMLALYAAFAAAPGALAQPAAALAAGGGRAAEPSAEGPAGVRLVAS